MCCARDWHANHKRILMQNCLRILALVAALTLGATAGCDRPAQGEPDEHGHVHGGEEGLEPISVTLFTSKVLLFMEYPHLVQGEQAEFLAHFSVLATGEPVRSGSLTFEVTLPSGPPAGLTWDAPRRDGLFVPEWVFETPGEYRLRLLLDGPQAQEVVDIGSIIVHADADAAFGTMTPDLIAAAPNLRWLQAPAAAPNAGYYFDELTAHPTKVTNFREIYNDHISVQILTYMLSFAKHTHLYRDFQNARDWHKLDSPHHDIFLPESTVLIVGIGGIGTETARLCKALGMRVLGIDARREDKPEWVDDMFPPDSLNDQLPAADFVVLTIPHTPQTEGLFDSSKFDLMKDSALLST